MTITPTCVPAEGAEDALAQKIGRELKRLIRELGCGNPWTLGNSAARIAEEHFASPTDASDLAAARAELAATQEELSSTQEEFGIACRERDALRAALSDERKMCVDICRDIPIELAPQERAAWISKAAEMIDQADEETLRKVNQRGVTL